MTTVTICIVGAGQLGSRHLQALAHLSQPCEIILVDPSDQATKTALERYAQVQGKYPVRTVRSLDALDQAIDLAIIATSSKPRRQLVEKLVSMGVRRMVLEKFLFPRLEDYETVSSLFAREKVKAWTNCTRRLWPFYRQLRDMIDPADVCAFQVAGTAWNLGSNGIHFVDLFSMLTGQTDIDYRYHGPSAEIVNSKREGYVDIVGMLQGETPRGDMIQLVNWKGAKPFYVMSLTTPRLCCRIDEIHLGGPKFEIAMEKDGWAPTTDTFDMPYQSQLSHLFVEDILINGQCDLTGFEESAHLHLSLLDAFLGTYRKKFGVEETICPVT